MPRKTVSSQAIEVLLRYPWPGNVRELKNLVERLVIMVQDSTIDIGDLPEEYRQTEGDRSAGSLTGAVEGIDNFRQAREDFEKLFIAAKLRECEGNVTKAAELMEIDRVHLHKKIKQYGIK